MQDNTIGSLIESPIEMSNKLLNVLGIIAHYKYLITVIIGVVLVGFVDENSFLQRVKYDLHISQLKAEIKK